MTSVLSTHGLTLTFGGLTAVRELSINIEPASIVAIIGPNGAGKTSAFNAITGIYSPTTGEVRSSGKTLSDPPTIRDGVRFSMLALAAGVFFVPMLHIQQLWHESVNALYRYREPFPWGTAAQSVGSTLLNMPLTWTALPALVVATLTFLGFWTAARRAKISPEVAARRGLARTFQNIRLFKQLTVLQNVLISIDRRSNVGFFGSIFRTRAFRRAEESRCKEAVALLASVGLEELRNEAAGSLPYGQQRRLEIARALAANPTVLLLDEPAAGMNPTEGEELMRLITSIRDQGIAVVLIEHHMRVVMGISDRIVVLHYGNTLAQGTPDEIRANPAVIEAYLGAPKDVVSA